MQFFRWLLLLVGLVATLGVGLMSGCSSDGPELLNVSYDPTRDLWKEINEKFREKYRAETGISVEIRQSHGGSGSQARAVLDGLDADIVTLALFSDTDAIRKKGLINDGKEGWHRRLPNNSLPYLSTIVFVVRQGNPKGIKDWPDLVRNDVKVITPNPQTSGNGQLGFLAAWAHIIRNGGTEEQAKDFVTRLYANVPVLDTAARAAAVTFAQRNIGDVHLTWENEAHLEVEEAKGTLEIVYPKASIQAEPYVAVVDKNVDRKATRALAEQYLHFLYTEEAQEILARHHYRPTSQAVLQKHANRLPPLELIPITRIATDWNEARERFFGAKGIFDRIQDDIRKRN